MHDFEPRSSVIRLRARLARRLALVALGGLVISLGWGYAAVPWVGAALAATGSGYLLGQAQAQEFRNGFFDQTAQVWNQAGVMLATSHQVVYFKA